MKGALAFLLALAGSAFAGGPLADEPMVDLAKVDPTILIDLRYATARNFTGAPLYPRDAKCLLREGVAQRLRAVQHILREQGYGLKVWDAYRPRAAQQKLWERVRDRDFVGDPSTGGSLHSWGIAVDLTLVDRHGVEMKMPSGFDDFTKAAAMRYTGTDPEIAKNLRILQSAMARAGFIGMRHEWWHFIPKNWKLYSPANLPASRFEKLMGES